MSYKYGHGFLTKKEQAVLDLLERDNKTLEKCDEDMSYIIRDELGDVILVTQDIEECYCAIS